MATLDFGCADEIIEHSRMASELMLNGFFYMGDCKIIDLDWMKRNKKKPKKPRGGY